MRDVRGPRQVAEDALAWVSAHRERFALGEDALAADGQVNRSWKPLGELAQVCATVSRHTAPPDPLHACAADLMTFAWQQTGRGELFVRLQRLEPFATYPLEVYAAMAAAGLRHPGYEAATATVARTRGWRLTEQEPTRRLGVLNAETRSGIRPSDAMPQALQAEHLAGRAARALDLRAVLRLLPHPRGLPPHRLGARRARGRTTGPGRLPGRLAAALARHLLLDAGMWDLGCELLAVAASLPLLPNPPSSTTPGHGSRRYSTPPARSRSKGAERTPTAARTSSPTTTPPSWRPSRQP
ncbi:hypothetical protein SPURM210S_08228 [Streptomyces purpurascens]